MNNQQDPKPKKKSILTSPRFQALLYIGASVATMLAMAPKKPAIFGE